MGKKPGLILHAIIYSTIIILLLAAFFIFFIRENSLTSQVIENPEFEVIKDCGEGTFIDRTGKLCWQEGQKENTKNWDEANSYCENLELVNKSNWRLPTFKEIYSVKKEISSQDPEQIKNPFWTSTNSSIRQNHYRFINFELNYSAYALKLRENYTAKCIREIV